MGGDGPPLSLLFNNCDICCFLWWKDSSSSIISMELSGGDDLPTEASRGLDGRFAELHSN